MNSSARGWATASLIAGGVWLVFSLLPTFITTALGLPLAAFGLLAGLWAWRAAGRAGDPSARRRAGWGLGLGCAGCLWQVIYYVFLAGLGLFAVGGAIGAFIHSLAVTPTP